MSMGALPQETFPVPGLRDSLPFLGEGLVALLGEGFCALLILWRYYPTQTYPNSTLGKALFDQSRKSFQLWRRRALAVLLPAELHLLLDLDSLCVRLQLWYQITSLDH